MGLDRDLIRRLRGLDPYELRRVMILTRGLLLHADGEVAEEEDLAGAKVTYRQEHVRCGKQACTSCPHGPYWYAYWKEAGRTRSQYIGRHLPGQPMEPVTVTDARSIP